MSQNKERINGAKGTDAENKTKVSEGGNFVFSTIRMVLIAVLVGYLVWTLAKGNPKFRSMIEKFAAAQKPTAAVREMISASGETMGTFWNVKIYDAPKDWNGERLAETVQKTVDRFDALMSTYKPDSEISRFNQSESTDWFPVSTETARVVESAQNVAKETGGALDITVGPLVHFWKFGPDKQPLSEFPSDETVDAIRSKTGYQNLDVRLDPPALKKRIPELCLDLSAVAKGFSVDGVADALKNEKIASFMVDVGGETYCFGTKGDAAPGKPVYSNRWLMGIEKPVKASPGIPSEGASFPEGNAPRFYRIVWILNHAIATSGDAHNAFMIGGKRYSHIIDPATGKPTEIRGGETSASDVGSVSVFDESCGRSDALATALYVLGPEKGIALADRLGLPVLYVLRNPDQSQSGEKGYPEKASRAFADIPSEKVESLSR